MTQHAAYHEAGHAVVRLRIWPGSARHLRATIKPDAETGGHVHHRKWTVQKASLGQLINEAVCALAGPIAEEHYTGRRNDGGAGQTDDSPFLVRGSDYNTVSEIVTELTGDDGEEQQALWTWLERRARNYVVADWNTIDLVAKALLERETLAGKELFALVYPQP